MKKSNCIKLVKVGITWKGQQLCNGFQVSNFTSHHLIEFGTKSFVLICNLLNPVVKPEVVVCVGVVVKLAVHSHSSSLLLDGVIGSLPKPSSYSVVQVHGGESMGIADSSCRCGAVSRDVSSPVQDTVFSPDLDSCTVVPKGRIWCPEPTANNVVLSRAPNTHWEPAAYNIGINLSQW